MNAGEEIGGYTLVRRLGTGGVGTVWLAEDGAGLPVALKLLHPALAASEAARRRLQRETATVNSVKSSHVAHVVDLETDASQPFIASEYIEGPTLASVIKNGPLAPATITALAASLELTIRAVHEARIVHRDIKPSNIVCPPSGPVLIDFGIAMNDGDEHFTRTGLVSGTAGYAAPELLRGKEADRDSDWWAWNATLLSAATGRPPFGVGEVHTLIMRVLAGQADTFGLDPRITLALRPALSPDPHARPSPQKVVSDLVGAFGFPQGVSELSLVDWAAAFDAERPLRGGASAGNSPEPVARDADGVPGDATVGVYGDKDDATRVIRVDGVAPTMPLPHGGGAADTPWTATPEAGSARAEPGDISPDSRTSVLETGGTPWDESLTLKSDGMLESPTIPLTPLAGYAGTQGVAPTQIMGIPSANSPGEPGVPFGATTAQWPSGAFGGAPAYGGASDAFETNATACMEGSSFTGFPASSRLEPASAPEWGSTSNWGSIPEWEPDSSPDYVPVLPRTAKLLGPILLMPLAMAPLLLGVAGTIAVLVLLLVTASAGACLKFREMRRYRARAVRPSDTPAMLGASPLLVLRAGLGLGLGIACGLIVPYVVWVVRAFVMTGEPMWDTIPQLLLSPTTTIGVEPLVTDPRESIALWLSVWMSLVIAYFVPVTSDLREGTSRLIARVLGPTWVRFLVGIGLMAVVYATWWILSGGLT